MVVAGRVGENMVRIDGKELQLIMITDESLGNCPKVFPQLERALTEVHYRTGYPVFPERWKIEVSGS